METYRQGFDTRTDLFAWLQTSRFFKPQFLIRAHPAMDRMARRNQRQMYDAFSKICEAMVAEKVVKEEEAEQSRPDVDAWREEALVFFGMKEEYDRITRQKILDRSYRETFSGKKVMEWTGLYGYAVANIMGDISKQYSKGDISQMNEEVVRELVLAVQKRLSVKSRRTRIR